MTRLNELLLAHIEAQAYPISERQIAMRIGITQSGLARWRAPGMKRLPEAEHLRAAARVLGVPYRVVLEAALYDTGYLQEVGDHDQRSAPKTQPAHLRGIPNHHDDDQGEDPPMPDFTQLAARSGRGESTSERLAREQDTEGEGT